MTLLSIEGLEVSFPAPGGEIAAVRGVSLSVGRGEIVGLVGESGSGKSLTALSVLRLLPSNARVAGHVLLEGKDLLALPEREIRAVRGRRIGMVFQEPSTALDPVWPIGFQIAEAVRAHRPVSRREAREEAARLLERVALADARRRLDDYPHQLSGGQRQRVMLAVALAAGPDLLLADEPTTALDVTIQAQVLDLLESLRDELGLSVLLITHDLGVVAGICDRIAVMDGGRIVEEGSVESVFRAPADPATRRLLELVPRLTAWGAAWAGGPAA
ncbi:MAG: ABC transporter ATP-binding protein [Acidobacteriota bacterium]